MLSQSKFIWVWVACKQVLLAAPPRELACSLDFERRGGQVLLFFNWFLDNHPNGMIFEYRLSSHRMDTGIDLNLPFCFVLQGTGVKATRRFVKGRGEFPCNSLLVLMLCYQSQEKLQNNYTLLVSAQQSEDFRFLLFFFILEKKDRFVSVTICMA